jgi:PilZ domain
VLPERWVLGVEVGMKANRRQTERRQWSRLPLAIPVFVRSRDRKGKEFLEFATALNVSAGGMLVAIRRILPKPIALLSLEIPSAPVGPARRSARTLRARTLRTTPADGCYLLGLKFSRPLTVSSKRFARPRKFVSSM